jgi:hypothetical protein
VNVDLNLQAVKEIAVDVWEDLGRTRLAGVAVGLALALLAITALALRPASGPDADAYTPAPAAVPEDEVSFTVPGQRPIQMSDVKLSSPRDPFRSLDGGGTTDQTLMPAGDSVQDSITAPSSSTGSTASSGVPSGYDSATSLQPLTDLDDTEPAPAPADGGDTGGTGDTHGDLGATPEPHAPESAPVTDYSYTVDIQFGLVDDLERYSNVHRLSLVPSSRLPLLMYLGVSTDHQTAVFMVDSRLSQGGEGKCVPKESLCTFLAMRDTPEQDEHHFRDADGNEYLLRLTRVIRSSAAEGSLHGRSVSELPGSPSMIDGAR